MIDPPLGAVYIRTPSILNEEQHRDVYPHPRGRAEKIREEDKNLLLFAFRRTLIKRKFASFSEHKNE
jgi:hypothetical protein